ncbi:hypothetical protein BJF79_33950 [Actinomadura sp. CNU-125]|uniref:hypothetical protein n=1 Tax=Actinomadura sp. CNU-125 TaxID=1904961 RepID=UPI000965DC6A|nr:hypothetical protein [Actinomadura sp. CNU-125]OLT34032.1 hypothetical protein BJF79_33950 [Actinomadura sp. CNU-125]
MGDVNDKTERKTQGEAGREAAGDAAPEGEERAAAREAAHGRKGAAPKPGDAARKMRAMFKG